MQSGGTSKLNHVIPAQAGIHYGKKRISSSGFQFRAVNKSHTRQNHSACMLAAIYSQWIPAYAGMTCDTFSVRAFNKGNS